MFSFKNMVREPLVHFIILGFIVFLYYEIKTADVPDDGSYEIIIDNDDLHRLRSTYQMNWNVLPDSSTLNALIDEEVKSEIYYREAKRLSLHHNDEIVRRRLRQKYEFLIDDLSELNHPTDENLKAFYHKNKDRYQTDEKWSFTQLYFEKSPPPNKIAKLLSTDPSQAEHSDPFHIPKNVRKSTSREIGRIFGNDFIKELEKHHEKGWISTPIISGYGYHMVHIDSYTAPIQKSFQDTKSEVLKDYKEVIKEQSKSDHYRSLKDQYTVRINND